MLVDWDEGNLLAQVGQASWDKPTATAQTNWNGGQAGTDYATTASQTLSILNGGILNQWMTWDIATLVQDWLDNPAGNRGMMLKVRDDHIPGVFKYFRVISSDNANATQRPKLTITYSEQFTTEYYLRDAAGQVIATYKKL